MSANRSSRSSQRPGVASSLGTANGSCVAMHVRRTDKHTEDRRVRERSFETFSHAFKVGSSNSTPLSPAPAPSISRLSNPVCAHTPSGSEQTWVYWSSSTPVPQLRVLLGSEDSATFSALPPLIAPTVAYWIPGAKRIY